MIVIWASRSGVVWSSNYTTFSCDVDVHIEKLIHFVVKGVIKAWPLCSLPVDFLTGTLSWREEAPWSTFWHLLTCNGSPATAFRFTLLLVDAHVATVSFLGILKWAGLSSRQGSQERTENCLSHEQIRLIANNNYKSSLCWALKSMQA